MRNQERERRGWGVGLMFCVFWVSATACVPPPSGQTETVPAEAKPLTEGQGCEGTLWSIAPSEKDGFSCKYLQCADGEVRAAAHCEHDCVDNGPKTITCEGTTMIPVPKGTLRLADYDFPFRVEFGTSVPDASELEEFASLKTLAMGRLKKDRDLVVSSCRVSDCGAAAFSIRIDKALVLPPRYYWIKNKLACVELFDSGEGETADSLYDVLTRRFGEPAPSEVPGSRGPSNKFKMVWRRDGLRVFYPLDASGDDRKALICNRAGAERLHKDVLQGARL